MEHNEDKQHSTKDTHQQDSQSGQVQAPPSLLPTVLSRLGMGNGQVLPGTQINELTAALSHRDWYVRVAAIRALGRLREQASIEPLVAALTDEDASVRAAAVHALGLLGERAPVNQLVLALHDSEWHVRETAILALGTLGEHVPAEPLRTALNDHDGAVRKAAVSALKQTHPDALSQVAPSPGVIPTPSSPWSSITAYLGGLTRKLSQLIRADGSGGWERMSSEADVGTRFIASLGGERPAPKRRNPLWRGVAVGLAIFVVLVNVIAWAILSQKLHPFSPGGHTATPTGTSTISPSWGGHNAELTIVSGVAYVGTIDGIVFALRISDGSVLWRYTTNGSVDESPLVVNSVIYVDSGDKAVYALRASNGTLLWHYTYTTTGDFYFYAAVPAPVMVNGVVYVGSQDGVVYALRGSDGALLWHYKTNGPVYEPLQAVNSVVYAFSDNGVFYALRASDGSLLWHRTNSYDYSAPTVVNGIAYFTVYNSPQDKGTLYALRASDGSLLWRYTSQAGTLGLALVMNGVVYIDVLEPNPNTASHGGGYEAQSIESTVQSSLKPAKGEGGIASVYALRASDGTVLWHYKLDNGGMDSGVFWLSVADGVAYVNASLDPSGYYVYALRVSDGALLWRSAVDGSVSCGLIVNGVAYLCFDNTIDALRTSDGTLLWHYTIYGLFLGPPILVGGSVYTPTPMLYIGSTSGFVYALRADTGAFQWQYLTFTDR